MAQQKLSDKLTETGTHLSRVLVVDPHATLRTVLAQRLRQDGHLAAAVATAREALDLCHDQSPDLLVSAELLEETSALRLAAQLHCPVMVLTARSGSEPVVALLDAGDAGIVNHAGADAHDASYGVLTAAAAVCLIFTIFMSITLLSP
jgi:CheY-like chemotaxis protein